MRDLRFKARLDFYTVPNSQYVLFITSEKKMHGSQAVVEDFLRRDKNLTIFT